MGVVNMEECKFVVFVSNISENINDLQLRDIFKFNSINRLNKSTALIGYNDNNQYQYVINQGIFV
jgi:hypothetical protein